MRWDRPAARALGSPERGGGEVFGLDRLLQALDHALAPGFEHLGDERVARQGDHGDIGALLVHGVTDLHPAAAGQHHEVGHDEVDLVAMGRPHPEPLVPAARGEDPIPELLEDGATILAVREVVLDEQNRLVSDRGALPSILLGR